MALYPQILPALEIKCGPQNFACSGTGLIKKVYSCFYSNIQAFFPLIEPKRTKAGKIAVRQPHVLRRAREWWKARCAFRGLSQAGTIANMQDRLRGSATGTLMTAELQEVQSRLNSEYLTPNAAAQDAKWLALKRNEARAVMDLR
ncbi:hypothetical protein EPUS_04190 [Endocarpon pusillum Z07020]|uniref:Uncharacterized protein n=1 Tax=Endocarpon pusillum (strain Z07020 / HMAS-L-300199) TaxID=1263415 RepID=U1GFB6_ENDPU|nr:uncharacterized protein EPUS_04190 [Endocarpon pusillum Z07020]ERF76332.1 hypothetical protein EPUS_04190 [Endocarpon pusillum Z07020]